MIDGPTMIDGFLPPSQCDYLVKVLEGQLEHDSVGGNASPDFDHRTVNLTRLVDPQARDILMWVRRTVADIACVVYRGAIVRREFRAIARIPLIPTYTDLVKWPAGSSLGRHVDNAQNFDQHRRISSVLMLNDLYAGGSHVHGEGEIVTARTGRMLIFPSWIPHAVTPVAQGTRYTLASWYTDDPAHEEVLR